MPPIAAIDIGSNSALLLIARRLPGGGWDPLVDTRRTVRLTKTPQAPGVIPESAIAVLEVALAEYQQIIEEQGATGRVMVAATQALRAADNGDAIAARIEQQFGWRAGILSGAEEARLSYVAAASGLESVATKRHVIDVGGGSTEIIAGTNDLIQDSTSIPIGAVSLSDRHDLADVVAAKQLQWAADSLAGEIETLDRFASATASTILVGGTASTLAALSLGQKVFDPNAVHGVELKTAWIGRQLEQLAAQNLEQRRELICFDPDRAEIIVGGVLILERLLKIMKIESAIVSNRGLRWGLLAAAAVTFGAD